MRIRRFGWSGWVVLAVGCAGDPGGEPAEGVDATEDTAAIDDTDDAVDHDDDGDGHVALEDGGDDCNDHSPFIHPGAPDHCDGSDDDCDGAVDEDFAASIDALVQEGTGYATVVEAVAAAAPGQQIWICPGEWTVPPLDVSGLYLRGSRGTDVTTLRAADPAGPVLTSSSGHTDLIGLRVTGATSGTGVRLTGGTMYMSSVTVDGHRTGIEVVGDAGTTLEATNYQVRHNVKEDGAGAGLFASGPVLVDLDGGSISSNFALDGGGVALEGGATLACDNASTSGNTASRDGGGLHLSDAILQGACDANDNVAGRDGGGAWLRQTSASGAVLSAVDNIAQGNGGAVALVGSELGLLWGAHRNQAAEGAGVHVDGGSSVILWAYGSLTENVASVGGGAVRVTGGGTVASDGVTLEFNAPDDILTDLGPWSPSVMGGAFTCTGAGGCTE